MIDQTCKIRWAFAGMESRVHSEIELFGWQCGFEGFLSQTVGLWCGFGGWVLWNWRLGTDGLEVGHWWFGGWVLWFWILGTTVGASLVVQRGAGNGAPCPAPVPNPPPLLCSCSAPSPALQVLNTTASFCTELICYAHELLIIWLQCMSHCCVVLLRQTTCIVRQLTGMALH